ncbi:MAG: outer membrane lipoprotein carrier protein LolA [Magnetospirillum sp. WYHS-4]
MLAAFLVAGGAQAAEKSRVKPIQLDGPNRALVAELEGYLNGMKTLEARFLQVASTGDVAEGRIYLSRPGRLRIEYDPPKTDLIVSDGLMLMHYDRELQQASHVFLDSTPAGILVDEKVALNSDKLTLIGLERESGAIRAGVVRSKDPGEGTVTLIFSEKPLALRKWIVVDAQGIVTTVTLQNPVFGQPLDKKLFYLEAPPGK